MGEWIVSVLLISLWITVVLELLFALIVGIRDKNDIVLVILVNFVTNPFVVLCYYMIYLHTNINLTITKLVLEGAAVLVETYFYKIRGNKIKHPLYFAIGANIFSYFIGLTINKLVVH